LAPHDGALRRDPTPQHDEGGGGDAEHCRMRYEWRAVERDEEEDDDDDDDDPVRLLSRESSAPQHARNEHKGGSSSRRCGTRRILPFFFLSRSKG
jgi:hypothetical protein